MLGYSPTATAWAYLPLVAGLVVAAGLGSVAVPRLGTRPVLVAGKIGCALGLVLLALIGMSQTRG